MIRAVDHLVDRRSRSVLVLGMGSVGRLAVLLLRDRLPQVTIMTYDPVATRSQWAGRYGAIAVESVESEIADAVIECSGTIDGFTAALRAAQAQGVIALEGVPERGETAVVAPAMMHFKELTLFGIYSSTMQSFQESLDWVSRREAELASMLEGPYGAADLPKLMERLASPDRRGKLYISWPSDINAEKVRQSLEDSVFGY